jgi:hypothetical protein
MFTLHAKCHVTDLYSTTVTGILIQNPAGLVLSTLTKTLQEKHLHDLIYDNISLKLGFNELREHLPLNSAGLC